jgi:hypothetical protein
MVVVTMIPSRAVSTAFYSHSKLTDKTEYWLPNDEPEIERLNLQVCHEKLTTGIH